MLSKKIENALNAQVEKESYSSALYLAMASWAETQGLEGTAKWLYIQSDEERLHMLKIIGYINERGGKALISASKQPPATFKNISEAFAQVLKHEEFITKSINDIVALCVKEGDFTTQNWLQWFVQEQIQEEKSARTILDKLKLSGESNLYLFDKDILSLRQAEAAGNTEPTVA